MQFSLAPRQTSQPIALAAGSVVTVTPATGATALVEYTSGTADQIANGAATWTAWSKGTVSTATRDVFGAAVTVRITAQGGGVVVDLNDIPSLSGAGALLAQSGSPTLLDRTGNKTPVTRAVDPSQFQRARKALANVKMGISNMRVAMISDSTGVGRGAVTDNIYTGARPFCPAEQLAKYLTKAGITANCNSYYGNGVFATTSALYNGYDPRVSWTGYTPTGAYCMGGGFLLANSAATFSFAPTTPLTDYEVHYIDFGPSTSIDIGGAGTVTVPNTNSGTMKKTTITAAASTGAFHANWLTGNSYVAGVIGTNSAVPEVTIVNMCGSGWGVNTVPGWASGFAAYSPLTSLKLYAPDLTIIRAGINDWSASVDLNLFKTNLAAIVTAAQISGDVLLEVSPYTSTNGSATIASMNSVRDAIRAVANTYGCGFNDNTARWSDEPTMKALGYFNADDVHIFRVGLSDLATSTLNVLLSL